MALETTECVKVPYKTGRWEPSPKQVTGDLANVKRLNIKEPESHNKRFSPV